jgi:acetyl-CoA acyltransferase
MAKLNGIAREAQDAWALRSHQRAHAATEDGRLLAEISPVLVDVEEPVDRDNGIRSDTTLEQLAKLRPVFDRAHGTVTAGNASGLTDGASALLLMGEDTARGLGYEPLAFIRSYAVGAVDPGWQLLMGPAIAVPRALEGAGITMRDVDLVEMHEAFASQVLSNLQAFGSREWAQTRLGRSEPIGEIDPEIINVAGGSIAIGHPFGATGGRLTLTLANEMRRRDVALGLVSVCAQGGIGFAMVLERS